MRKKIGIIITAIILLGIIVAGAGFLKYRHDLKVEQERQAQAYVTLKSQEEKALNQALQSRKTQDITKVQSLIDKLHSSDKKAAQTKLTSLEQDLKAIEQATTAVNSAQNKPSGSALVAAQAAINQLNSTYEQGDKSKLQKLLDAQKAKVAQEQAAALRARQAQEAKKAADKVNLPAGSKIIALTFDDGPNPLTTPQLLATLKSANVHATFFALGQQAQAYPSLIKQEAAQGNEVASHTWDHQDLTTLSPAAQKQEIESASNLINSLTGQDVKLFRPPYGSYNQTVLAQTDLSAINWSVDTNDWRYNTSAPVLQNALSSAHDGAIILLHDIHSWSVAAVPQIIQSLTAQGYHFVTVSQLLALRAGGAQPHQVYFGQ